MGAMLPTKRGSLGGCQHPKHGGILNFRHPNLLLAGADLGCEGLLVGQRKMRNKHRGCG